MSDTYSELVADLKHALATRPLEKQFWLGITGPPGVGKSTLSQGILESVEGTLIIPMDGYHYYRAELDAMAEPEVAHRRRGAPFTFNAERFVAELTVAREVGSGSFPSFQHGVGDPIENDITLDSKMHRLVIVEGNYLLLNAEPWCQLAALFDETWYLHVDVPVLHQRLTTRFKANGLSETAAQERVESNDVLNADLVEKECMPNATRVLKMR